MISKELRKLVDPNNKACCEHHLSNMVKEWAWNEGYKISTEKTLNSGWESKLFYLDSDAISDDVYGEDGYIISFYTNSNGINSDFQAGECILKELNND